MQIYTLIVAFDYQEIIRESREVACLGEGSIIAQNTGGGSMRLSIHLLGPFHVTLDGEPVTDFESNKVRALLAYLALEADRPHSRDALIGLLWPDQAERSARRSLSQALFNLRQAIRDEEAVPPFLCVSRETIQFNVHSDYWLDVDAFARHVAAAQGHSHPRLETCELCLGQLEQAEALYRDEFLAGFFVDDSVSFSDWAALWRERLHRQVLDALYQLTEHYERQRGYTRALHYARRQVELETWREEAHQQMMRLLVRSGQRSAALQQYELCRRNLADELDVEPSPETQRLYRRIRSATALGAHNMPPHFTPFVGREAELRDLAGRLADPACRLLTLLGPGGIGKTRLAIQAAQESLDIFLHGVYFVPLASVDSAGLLVSAVAIALGSQFQFRGAREPLAQLLDYVREKELLLVMDSFEHLIPGAELLATLVQSAPDVKILVTSRERLNLQAEWIFDVEGLTYPHAELTGLVKDYGAVQLFLQNAKRIREDFALSQETQPHVARICQLVEGMPLGIELASAWVRVLSCEQIANDIQRNMDFLVTPLRDVPERHRSMRAIFDHSCRLLSDEERDVFYRLSVFRGEFRSEAAKDVAGASPPVLVTLVDKSLLRRSLTGQYAMHELLRQYAREKLGEISGAGERTRDLHSAYYADFLHERGKRLKVAQQKGALEAIGLEIDDVRAAWEWALERGVIESIGEFLDGLYDFYCVRGWFQEGEEAFGRAAAKLRSVSTPGNTCAKEQAVILSKLLARQGRFSFHRGHYEKSRELCQTSLSTSRRLGDRENEAFSLINLGFVSYVFGEYAEAKKFSQESLAIFRDLGDQSGVALCLNSLGNVARSAEEHAEARQLYQECLAIRREVGDVYGTATTLNNLGNIAEALGEYAEARKLYQEGLSICQNIGYQLGIAASLTNLGYVAWKCGEYAEAKRLHGESLDLKMELGDSRSILVSLINIGEATCSLGEYQESKKHLGKALKMATETRLAPLAVEVLIGIASLLAKSGKKDNAVELCAFILHYPASRKELQDRAADLLTELASRLPPEILVAARAQALAWTLEEVLAVASAILDKCTFQLNRGMK